MTMALKFSTWRGPICAGVSIMSLIAGSAALAADVSSKDAEATAYMMTPSHDWAGFYVGGHIGYAWGNSNWSAAGADGPASGSIDFSQGVDVFSEAGSWNEGLQLGYNIMLSNRVLLGAEADFTFQAFPDPLSGLTTGGMATYAAGNNLYSDTLQASGTVRGRIGYAPGNWLYYATGGWAWTSELITLTQQSSGVAPSSIIQRQGWVAGVGVEAPLFGRWTGKAEYLYSDYGSHSVNFSALGDRINSSLTEQQVRLGLNYKFGDDPAGSTKDPAPAGLLNADDFSLHGQATAVWMGYPAIHQAYNGAHSLFPGGEIQETVDVTLNAGYRPWQGGEVWTNLEIDQGYGPGNTLGVAGYVSGEAYKLGQSEPYARVQRLFLRQTFDLGGATQKVEADTNIFEGSQTEDRVVVTAGRFYIPDLFDTNKYANNPKSDFLNWSIMNAGTFDFAADAWGSTYGVAAEWYQGRYTARGGVFDLTITPAGSESPLGIVPDRTFQQLEWVGELEERHDLWGQPGKLKVTGYLINGRMGSYSDAIAYIAANSGNPAFDPGAALQPVRRWNVRPGVSVNLEQQVTPDVGMFLRAGWGDGSLEVYDFTDINETVSGGFSVSGKLWGRPEDTWGVAGVVNHISNEYRDYLNAGGLGLQIGDGALNRAGLEQILETYYSLPFSFTHMTFDYQLVVNPAYNKDTGPVSLFGLRLHTQF